ncbi:MAG: hypothetical protein HY906_19410 [Deltaproteobacteria bacterium]|nr:hypothetical protein [Deltaproteobacteria bacterium]
MRTASWAAIVSLALAGALTGCGGTAGAGRDAATGDAPASAEAGAGDAGGAPDGSTPDGMAPDGAEGDGGGPGPADYAEPAGEGGGAGNDPYLGGTPEATGLAIGPGGGFTLEGTIATDRANEVWADSDGFRFTVSATTTLRAELSYAPAAGVLWQVAILRVNRSLVAWWSIGNQGAASTRPVTLGPGDYVIHVAAGLPAPSTPQPYRVRVQSGDWACAVAGGAADYAEADEAAAGHRANDVAAVRWVGFPQISPAGGASAAEATGLTLGAGQTRALEGLAASVTSAGDGYLDRDAYEVTAGADAREIHVRVDHTGQDVNLNVFIFAAGDTGKLLGTATDMGATSNEVVVPVTAGAKYWIWVGTRDERSYGLDTSLPLTYRVTACAR